MTIYQAFKSVYICDWDVILRHCIKRQIAVFQESDAILFVLSVIVKYENFFRKSDLKQPRLPIEHHVKSKILVQTEPKRIQKISVLKSCISFLLLPYKLAQTLA